MTPDYWALSNKAHQDRMYWVKAARLHPDQPYFQQKAAHSFADCVMYLALEQWEINHGKRKV